MYMKGKNIKSIPRHSYQYIKIYSVRLCVCVSVTDVGVAATNLRFVRFSFHRNGHFSFLR